MIDRVPPSSPDTEKSVLGSCLLAGRKTVANAINVGLEEDDFYITAHKKIWIAIAAVWDTGHDPDIETVYDSLLAAGLGDTCGGTPYLSELQNVASSPNLLPWVKILKQYSSRRRMIAVGNKISERAYDMEIPTRELEADAQDDVFRNISSVDVDHRPRLVKELIPEFFERVKGYSTGVIQGIKTGFEGLDARIGGLMNSDLILVAGRPSMGKSAWAMSLALSAARAGKKVLFCSLETSRAQWMERLVCMEAGVEMARLRAGRLPQSEHPKLDAVAGPIGDLPLIIDDTPDLSCTQLRSKLMRMDGIELVIVDYLQYMTGPGRPGNEQTSGISRGLKMIAKEFDIPVVPLSQLSRAVEQRGGDKRPVLSDLRDSGSLEQDADVVLFVYRGEYYFRDDESLKGKGEIIVSKQRNGPTGFVPLEWQAAFARFVNPKYGEPTPGWEDDV